MSLKKYLCILIIFLRYFDLESTDYIRENILFYAKKDDCSNERIARKGILIKRKNAKANIIILHGYGTDKFTVSPFRMFFKDYNCLTFDFRAHGEEIDDQYCTIGHDEIYDLFAAADFVKTHKDLKDKPILIWAPSMGAATAIEAQAIDPNLCKGMFLDAPFSSSKEIVEKSIENLKIDILGYSLKMPCCKLLGKMAFNSYIQPILKYLLKKIAQIDATKVETFAKPIYPIESIRKVNVPCFFCICKNDEKISVEGVIKMYKNHPGPKKIWITEGKDHCHSVFNDPEKYDILVNDFFNSVLNGNIYHMPKEVVLKD